ncbi:unnamed protein product, partial [Mesorhabditis belari]|uniref:Uncharacterized protein n=1 Tax=Mesorhabditis belari TaxID=2138241 RepID=A0AAF3F614_9BILA
MSPAQQRSSFDDLEEFRLRRKTNSMDDLVDKAGSQDRRDAAVMQIWFTRRQGCQRSNDEQTTRGTAKLSQARADKQLAVLMEEIDLNEDVDNVSATLMEVFCRTGRVATGRVLVLI